MHFSPSLLMSDTAAVATVRYIYLNSRTLDVMLSLHVLNQSVHCHCWLTELVIYFSSCHRAGMIWDTG